MTLAEFKNQVLRCVVLDTPWDTSLVWADADADLDGLSSDERDRAVTETLMEL